MNSRIYLLSILFMFLFSCSSEDEVVDPCTLDMDAIECDSGDFDQDGIVNGEDENPSDPCVPNLPSFEMNLIGEWSYFSGIIKFNEDGTYEEEVGEIISNGVIESRMWRIEDERLFFDIGNASLNLSWLDYDCDSFELDGEGFVPNILFTRR